MTGVLHLMRLTFETITPLSIGSGDAVPRIDPGKGIRAKEEPYLSAGLVRDANDLPTIPGAALQGVWRSLYQSELGVDAARDLFGCVEGDEGKTARLVVGFGCLHDSHDRAVVGLLGSEGRNDGLLSALSAQAPLERDHVGLNARHVAAGHQKFARTAVPAGARFSCEVSMWGAANEADNDRALLVQLARLVRHPAFRLGGSGARGYGAVKLHAASYRRVELADTHALRELRTEPPSRPLSDDFLQAEGVSAPFADVTVAKLELTPLNPWRIGGRHAPAMTEGTHGVRLPDGSAPVIDDMDIREAKDGAAERDVQRIVREPFIAWGPTGGELKTPVDRGPWIFPAPGSAIKGPLVHRTLFHFNRLAGRTVDVDAWLALPEDKRAEQLEDYSSRPVALQALLGEAKPGVGGETARAARLQIGGGEVSGVTAVQAVDHSSIDRFTGGVRDKILFAEEVLVGGTLRIDLVLRPPLADDPSPQASPSLGGWDRDVADALILALHDLCFGALAVGAKSLGFCEGSIAWSGDAADSWDARASVIARERGDQRAWSSFSRPEGARL